jgi:hypothetical protein
VSGAAAAVSGAVSGAAGSTSSASCTTPGHGRRAKSVWSPEMDPQPPGRNLSVVGLLTATIRCRVCSSWIPLAEADEHSEVCCEESAHQAPPMQSPPRGRRIQEDTYDAW